LHVAVVGLRVEGVVKGPLDAWAKGSALRFEEEEYAPGDRAVAHAIAETWPSSAGPENAPFNVYLTTIGPLWFGHLPPNAPRVGKLLIGDQIPDRTTDVGDTYRVSVEFTVPELSPGRYWVWVCNKECGANSSFGDLVDGRLTVKSSTAQVTARPRSILADLNPSNRTPATTPWRTFGLPVLLAVGFGMLLVLWRRRRVAR
jgi:hypothetical protein